MNDREWLEQVSLAYHVYSKQVGPNLSIERFIEWLYQQYSTLQSLDKNNLLIITMKLQLFDSITKVLLQLMFIKI